MYIIRTDSMIISEDFDASLEFVDDNTGNKRFIPNVLDKKLPYLTKSILGG